MKELIKKNTVEKVTFAGLVRSLMAKNEWGYKHYLASRKKQSLEETECAYTEHERSRNEYRGSLERLLNDMPTLKELDASHEELKKEWAEKFKNFTKEEVIAYFLANKEGNTYCNLMTINAERNNTKPNRTVIDERKR